MEWNCVLDKLLLNSFLIGDDSIQFNPELRQIFYCIVDKYIHLEKISFCLNQTEDLRYLSLEKLLEIYLIDMGKVWGVFPLLLGEKIESLISIVVTRVANVTTPKPLVKYYLASLLQILNTLSFYGNQESRLLNCSSNLDEYKHNLLFHREIFY